MELLRFDKLTVDYLGMWCCAAAAATSVDSFFLSCGFHTV